MGGPDDMKQDLDKEWVKSTWLCKIEYLILKLIYLSFIGDVRRSNGEFQRDWRENVNSEGEGGGFDKNGIISEGMLGGGQGVENFGTSEGKKGVGGG